MKHRYFTVREELQRFAAAVDAKKKLPRRYTQEDIDSGLVQFRGRQRVPVESLRTDTFALAVVHPSRAEWAYPVGDLEGEVVRLEGRDTVIDTLADAELSSDWNGARLELP